MHPAERATWEILVSENASAERSFQLSDGSLIVGACPDCAVVTTSPGIAPRHAEFLATPGMLQLRALEETPPVLLNGAPVRGLVDVTCPATAQIGSLHLSVKEAAANGPSKTDQDSTLRIIHPARSEFGPITDPENLDVTGRIVYRLPGAEDTASPGTAAAGAKGAPLLRTAFSREVTMAFSVENREIFFSDKVPVRMDYEVKEEIARGGMGRIFSAEDTSLDRHVALKVSTVGDPDRAPQFFREAKILAALAHPNIVPIHNLGVDEAGRPFYSMKLIQGQTLQSIIKQLASGDREIAEAYPRMRLLEIFRRVCDAVSFAHAKGYLHRDLKPDNIMVGEFGEVLVMDWGLAKSIRRPGSETAARGPEEDEPETLPYIEGTPQYMSPEQANGVYGGLDERSDIYSLGGILYAILTRRPPVRGASLNEVLEKVRNGETTTMAMPQGALNGTTPQRDAMRVPDALKAVTFKALAKDSGRRYRSVPELARDIEAYIGGFATAAEAASLSRQVFLFVKRHRAATSLAAFLLVGAVAFTARLAASERRAQASAITAERASQEAVVNAKKADEQRLVAENNARQALAEKEEARRAAASASIAQAIAAREMQNIETMHTVLSGVPPDLRTQQWHYLNRYLDSSERTISAKGDSPWQNCVAHPQEAGVLLTLQEENWIRSLNLYTGKTKELLKLDGPLRSRSLEAVSPDATLIAVCKAPWTQIEIVKLSNGETVFSLGVKNIKNTAIKFSPNGKYLLKVGREGPAPEDGIALFNLETGQMMGQRNMEHIYDADFVDDGAKIRIAAADQGLRSISIDRLGDIVPPNAAPLPAIKFPPLFGSKLFLSNGGIFYNRDDLIRKIDLSGAALDDIRLPARLKSVSDVYFSQNENLLVTLVPMAETSAMLQIRSATTASPYVSAPIVINFNKGPYWRMLTHPLSNHVAVFRGTTMKVWKAERVGKSVSSLDIPTHFTSMVFAFVGNANQFVAMARSNERIYSVEKGMLTPSGFNKTPFISPSKGDNLTGVIIAPSRSPGKVAIGRRDLKEGFGVKVYGEQANSLVEEISFQGINVGERFALSPQGDLIWVGSSFYSTTTGRLLSTLDGSSIVVGDRTIRASQFCWTDNAHVVEIRVLRNKDNDGEDDAARSMVLWRVSDAKMMSSAPARSAVAIAASPDGLLIAEGGKDKFVRIRDAKTLQVTRELLAHDAPLADVAWHPSRPHLATVGEDLRLRIWDLGTKKPGEELLEEINFLQEMPSRLYWSPDGRTLVVGGAVKHYFFTPKSCGSK
jgi:serine/threonine protein kinase/WD40 repeat protein